MGTYVKEFVGMQSLRSISYLPASHCEQICVPALETSLTYPGSHWSGTVVKSKGTVSK